MITRIMATNKTPIIIGIFTLSNADKFSSPPSTSPSSVSYTHLDVYKRQVHIQLFSAYTYFYYIVYIFFIHILYSCNNYNLLLYCIIFRQKAQYIFGIFCQIKFKYFHVAIYDFQHTLKISRYSVPLQDTGCGLYALRKASASGTEHLL